MAASGEVEDTKGTDNHAEQQESTKLKMTQELTTKHPLQNSWTLWFFKNDKTKSWAANLRKVITFDSVFGRGFLQKITHIDRKEWPIKAGFNYIQVEDFWGVYNHILLASKLQSGCDYSVFKDGIKPMWEDDQNRLGGRWLINLNKNARNQDLDRIWLELLLCLIGEAFGDDNDGVNGAVVQIRNKGDKIGLWTGKADDQDSIMRIGKGMKERLNMPGKYVIGYQSHVDTAGKTGSTAKNRYTL